MKNKSFDKEERMFTISYWLLFGFAFAILAFIFGSCGWAMWIITKAVTA